MRASAASRSTSSWGGTRASSPPPPRWRAGGGERRRPCRPARAASHLSARGAVLDRRLPRRCRGGLCQARALPDRGERRHPRRERRGDRTQADARRRRGGRPRQCAAFGLRRARRRARRSRQDGADPRRAARPRGCAPTRSAISSAAGPSLRRSIRQRRAPSAATPPSLPPRATHPPPSSSSAPATTPGAYASACARADLRPWRGARAMCRRVHLRV